MSSGTKKKLVWIGSGVFVVAFAWWLCRFPFDRLQLYKAIPGDAVVVAEHDTLAGRWESVLKNKAVTEVAVAMGSETNEVAELADDPVAKDLVKRFGSRLTVTAYVPSLAGTGYPALVLSSWAGGNANILRWGLIKLLCGDFRLLRVADGAKIWVLEQSEEEKARKAWFLSLTVADGVLLGCYSPMPDVVNLVRRIYDRNRGSESEFAPLLEAGMNPKAPDRWCFVPAQRNIPAFKGSVLLKESGALEGEVVVGIPLPDVKPGDMASARADAKSLLGDAPVGIAFLPVSEVRSQVNAAKSSGWGKAAFNKLVEASDTNTPCMFISLLGNEYKGRILGYKNAPTLVVGLKLSSPSNGLDVVTGLMDEFNAKHKLGLIPGYVDVAAPQEGVPQMRILTVQSAKRGIISSLTADMRGSFAMKGDWLIFSSNVAALKKLLTRTPGEKTSDAAPRWDASLAQAGHPMAFLWIDLASTGKAMKDALAVAALVMIAAGDEGMSEDLRSQVRGAINTGIKTIDPLMVLKTFSAWVPQSSGNHLSIEFRIGE